MEIDKIGSEEEFYERTSREHVIVLFTSLWCNPSKKLKELISEFDESRYSPKKEIPYLIEVDIDDFPKLTEKFKIKGIPNVLTFQSGKIINQAIGLKEELFVSPSSIIKL